MQPIPPTLLLLREEPEIKAQRCLNGHRAAGEAVLTPPAQTIPGAEHPAVVVAKLGPARAVWKDGAEGWGLNSGSDSSASAMSTAFV